MGFEIGGLNYGESTPPSDPHRGTTRESGLGEAEERALGLGLRSL